MKFFVMNTDYTGFLWWLYKHHPGLADAPYEEQQRVRVQTHFGTADAFSHFLRALGHEAIDVFPNNEIMQRRWAAENGVRCTPNPQWDVRLRHGFVPWPYRRPSRAWLYEILAAQIKAFQPDVLHSMAVDTVGTEFLRGIKGHYRLAIAQHASMVPGHQQVRGYDLVLSSLPNLVEHFRNHGMRAEPFRLGFDPRVLDQLNGVEQSHGIVFVGGLSGVQHEPGARLLERVCERHDVQVWGHGDDGLPEGSPLRQRCRGPLWGRPMFETFRASRIVLNRHGPIAGPYANNMRLYEATGVGALLLTDQKDNLAEMFAPGREVVAYRDPEECIELASHYLAHDDEREAIAQAGQARTLREHTYAQRTAELVEIAKRYL